MNQKVDFTYFETHTSVLKFKTLDFIEGDIMNKRTRQYIGLLSAVAFYYLIHEGAHLIYALCIGVFKQINFMGFGMQIDVYADKMTETQLGIFCLVGSISTILVAYTLVLLTNRICKSSSKVFMACMYYITIIMLLLDPIYLSLLFSLFGGGDMNGISLLIPEWIARIGYGILFIVNMFVLLKIVLPKYKLSFSNKI